MIGVAGDFQGASEAVTSTAAVVSPFVHWAEAFEILNFRLWHPTLTASATMIRGRPFDHKLQVLNAARRTIHNKYYNLLSVLIPLFTSLFQRNGLPPYIPNHYKQMSPVLNLCQPLSDYHFFSISSKGFSVYSKVSSSSDNFLVGWSWNDAVGGLLLLVAAGSRNRDTGRLGNKPSLPTDFFVQCAL